MMQTQREVAMVFAQQVRHDRARLKEDLKDGRASALDVLAEPPAFVARVPIGEFLTWVPWVGRARASRVLDGIVSETVPLGGVGAFSRGRVAAELTRQIRPFAVAA